MARKTTTAGQLAALFPADALNGFVGLGIDPDESGDQLDIFGAVADAEANAEANAELVLL